MAIWSYSVSKGCWNTRGTRSPMALAADPADRATCAVGAGGHLGRAQREVSKLAAPKVCKFDLQDIWTLFPTQSFRNLFSTEVPGTSFLGLGVSIHIHRRAFQISTQSSRSLQQQGLTSKLNGYYIDHRAPGCRPYCQHLPEPPFTFQMPPNGDHLAVALNSGPFKQCWYTKLESNRCRMSNLSYINLHRYLGSWKTFCQWHFLSFLIWSLCKRLNFLFLGACRTEKTREPKTP